MFKNEGSGKRLLVPIVALLLCIPAAAFVVHAALESTATSEGNTLDGDVITVSIGDESGVAENLSTSYDLQFGQFNGRYYAKEEQVIGSGVLKIDVSKYKGTKINVKSEADFGNGVNTYISENSTLEIRFDDVAGDGPDKGKITGHDVTDKNTVEFGFKVYIVYNGAEENIKHVGGGDEKVVFVGDNLENITGSVNYAAKFTVSPGSGS